MSCVMFQCKNVQNQLNLPKFSHRRNRVSVTEGSQEVIKSNQCLLLILLWSIIHSWIGEPSTLEPIEGFNLTSFGQLLSGCSDCWFHNQAGLGGWWLISPAEVFISVKLGTKFSPLMASWKENNPNINYLTKLKLRFD